MTRQQEHRLDGRVRFSMFRRVKRAVQGEPVLSVWTASGRGWDRDGVYGTVITAHQAIDGDDQFLVGWHVDDAIAELAWMAAQRKRAARVKQAERLSRPRVESDVERHLETQGDVRRDEDLVVGGRGHSLAEGTAGAVRGALDGDQRSTGFEGGFDVLPKCFEVGLRVEVYPLSGVDQNVGPVGEWRGFLGHVELPISCAGEASSRSAVSAPEGGASGVVPMVGDAGDTVDSGLRAAVMSPGAGGVACVEVPPRAAPPAGSARASGGVA